jgi:hypothetical protein
MIRIDARVPIADSRSRSVHPTGGHVGHGSTPKVRIQQTPWGAPIRCTQRTESGQPLFAPAGVPSALANRSCVPDAVVELERMTLEAARRIEPAEEVTWNRLTTEWRLAAPFSCACESTTCVGSIRGVGFVTRSHWELLPRLSPFLRTRECDDVACDAAHTLRPTH